MQDILFSLLAWIGALTGYDVRLELPNLVMTTTHNMCAQYGIHHKSQCDHAALKGFYDKDLTIYFGTDFDPGDLAD
ncbi:MAG: hypothetical protein JSW10_04090 [Pseudomonadota bacterium]|nr:MAG: hypothetical protein JSW10_04090 [Pseudomonadota bacterium]